MKRNDKKQFTITVTFRHQLPKPFVLTWWERKAQELLTGPYTVKRSLFGTGEWRTSGPAKEYTHTLFALVIDGTVREVVVQWHKDACVEWRSGMKRGLMQYGQSWVYDHLHLAFSTAEKHAINAAA